MEHGASERVKEQSHAAMPVKTEVDKAAQSTACRGVQTNVNFTKEEPGLAQLLKSEPALLVKEEVMQYGWRDIAELQCWPSTSTIVGSTNLFDSVADPGNTLNIKEELGSIDIGPTVIQPTDTQGTTKQKDMIVVKQEHTINHHNLNPILCGRVKEEIIEDEWRELTGAGLVLPAGSPTTQDSLMEQPGTCTALRSLHKECLETVCRVQLIRLDTFQCDDCDAVYIHAHKLFQHVQDLHGPGPKRSLHVKSPEISIGPQRCARGPEHRIHICDYCKKTFKRKRILHIHITSVHASGSYKCSQCNMCFKCKLYLMGHTRRIHPAADTDAQRSQLNSCDKCGKTYASKKSLMAHYRSLHSTQSHKCTKCNKKFPSKDYLYTHARRVHSEQQYECAVCKKIYGSKPALNNHVYNAHRPRPAGSEPRIYICDYCQKTFTLKWNVGAHITQVHACRSYKCSQCNMRFKCEQYLIGHTRRNHPAESHQLHTCANCGKNFKYKQNCQRHEKRGECTRPTASSTSAAASTSIRQRNVIIVKEEPADGELDLGPVVFQHMDCNYRPYKPEPGLD